MSAVKRLVKREISRTLENKSREVVNLGVTLFPSNDTANADINNQIQLGFRVGGLEIAQGTGNGARVGNQVKVKRVTFKGTIVPYPYNATTNPVPPPTQIKMFLFYPKDNAGLVPTPYVSANFFDLNNSVQGFHNDLVDMWATPNAQLYKVCATKIFKLGYASNDIFAAGTSGTNNFSNSDFKLNCNFSMDITKYLPKSVIYNDNSLNSTSRTLYALFVVARADGTFLTSTWRTAGMQYQVHAEYEDA
jgi:hypothetical protein